MHMGSMNKKTPTFTFGKNWRNYIEKIDSERINAAKKSLCTMLGKTDLKGLRFLDAGCGSGLFSLSAIKLGAEEVISFDVDKDSTECARLLNKKYGPFQNWKILEGNALDKKWLMELNIFDIVYSWGVLHHTGDMWRALENITFPVKNNGILFISIYNNQGYRSKIWTLIKSSYNKSSKPLKLVIASTYHVITLVYRTLTGILNASHPRDWYKGSERGMSLWNDSIDWVGGYPYETATAKEILDFFHNRGFETINTNIKTGIGCSEFVFQKS
jgi:2-polyprenyl-6-hydroxyphenyl methylase/3-demethylubiquinone-9 3-methyltransferase